MNNIDLSNSTFYVLITSLYYNDGTNEEIRSPFLSEKDRTEFKEKIITLSKQSDDLKAFYFDTCEFTSLEKLKRFIGEDTYDEFIEVIKLKHSCDENNENINNLLNKIIDCFNICYKDLHKEFPNLYNAILNLKNTINNKNNRKE